MSLPLFTGLPPWAALLVLAAHLVAGLGFGALYFHGLWWNARLYISGRSVATALILAIGRLLCLTGLLTLASLEGALPLLVLALGMLIARPVVMHRIREGAP